MFFSDCHVMYRNVLVFHVAGRSVVVLVIRRDKQQCIMVSCCGKGDCHVMYSNVFCFVVGSSVVVLAESHHEQQCFIFPVVGRSVVVLVVAT